jgi:hypothetical protein
MPPVRHSIVCSSAALCAATGDRGTVFAREHVHGARTAGHANDAARSSRLWSASEDHKRSVSAQCARLLDCVTARVISTAGKLTGEPSCCRDSCPKSQSVCPVRPRVRGARALIHLCCGARARLEPNAVGCSCSAVVRSWRAVVRKHRTARSHARSLPTVPLASAASTEFAGSTIHRSRPR